MAQLGGTIPQNWKEFRQLPGVGDYIASAVLSIAFDQPYAVVDGNVKRVLARMFQMQAPTNQSTRIAEFKTAAEKLLHRRHPGMFNQALMELGAVLCTPQNPDCAVCPVQSQCKCFRDGSVDHYPKRVRSKPRPTVHIAIGVIYRQGRILITQRPTHGLLGGLWEFPGGKLKDGEDPADGCLREIKEEVNLEVAIETHLTRIKHGYTHFKVVLEVFRCRHISGRVKLNGPVDYRWVRLKELEEFPLPRANLKFIHLLESD
jgi:A/G-specific adenine glycosylase